MRKEVNCHEPLNSVKHVKNTSFEPNTVVWWDKGGLPRKKRGEVWLALIFVAVRPVDINNHAVIDLSPSLCLAPQYLRPFLS